MLILCLLCWRGSSIPGPSHGICSYLLGRRMPLREIESSDVTNLLKKDAPHTIFTYVLPTKALVGHKEFLPQGVLGGALNQAERPFWGYTVIPHSGTKRCFRRMWRNLMAMFTLAWSSTGIHSREAKGKTCFADLLPMFSRSRLQHRSPMPMDVRCACFCRISQSSLLNS